MGRLFRVPVRKIFTAACAFSHESFLQMEIFARPAWMFASENGGQATLMLMKSGEVPTTFNPDGRNRPRPAHLAVMCWRHSASSYYRPALALSYPGVGVDVASGWPGVSYCFGGLVFTDIGGLECTPVYAFVAFFSLSFIAFATCHQVLCLTEGLLTGRSRLNPHVPAGSRWKPVCWWVAADAPGGGSVHLCCCPAGQDRFSARWIYAALRIVMPSVFALTMGVQNHVQHLLPEHPRSQSPP